MAKKMTVAEKWQSPDCDAWSGLGARLADFVHDTAERTDLIMRVTIRDDDTDHSPACFVPWLAEVRFAAKMIFTADEDDPDCIDPQNPTDRALYPHLMGLAAHEAAHAAHTRWEPAPDSTPATVRWTSTLEEPRIEHRLVSRMPKARIWLRAAMDRLNSTDGVYTVRGDTKAAAVHDMVLIAGRAMGGVLDEHEVAAVRTAAAVILGDEDMTEVEQIIADALAVEDADSAGLLACGARLATVVSGEDEPDAGEADAGEPDAGEPDAGEPDAGEQGAGEQGAGEQGAGQPGEPVASQFPCGSWTQGVLPEGVQPEDLPVTADNDGAPQAVSEAAEALAAAATNVLETIAEQAKAQSIAQVTLKMPVNLARAEQEARAEITQRDARIVFGAGTGQWAPITVQSLTPDATTKNETRALITELRRAQYRGVAKTRVRRATPPGRLNSSRLMQQQAQLDMGTRMSAQPWTATRRREIERPELAFGISSDVSESMSPYQAGAARMTYAIGQAVRHLGGTVAGVAWNHDAAVTVHPGDTANLIRQATCGGSSEGCPRSLTALDGALQLTANRTRVRVVTVVTDGRLGNYDDINRELAVLLRAGVHILWVTPRADRRVHSGVSNLLLAPPVGGMGDFGRTLGAAVSRLLESA